MISPNPRQIRSNDESRSGPIVVSTSSSTTRVVSARQLLRALIQHYRERTNKSILHHDNLALAATLMERCRQLDTMESTVGRHSLLRELLLAKDTESGYTPLHWAIYQGNLPMILLLLRVASGSDNLHTSITKHSLPDKVAITLVPLTQKPMKLLLDSSSGKYTVTTGPCGSGSGRSVRSRSQSFSSQNGLLACLTLAADNDGQTPADLLADIQRGELAACRKTLYRPKVIRNKEPQRKCSDDDEQDEFDLLHRGMQVLHQSTPEHNVRPIEVNYDVSHSRQKITYGCEVISFGSAHHCTLGVPEDRVNECRPQRVPAFTQQDSSGGAVAIAAATHHTLVATAAGHLYAFGLGKGGRLGTGSEVHSSLPTRVGGPLLHQFVVAIAAAENHSLCVCRTGAVFAWGSNRFGQLGITTSGGDEGSNTLRFNVPRRLDDLKQVVCVDVAAGERHSVALSQKGEVYAWGDNSAGQLGIMGRRNGTQKVQRLEGFGYKNQDGQITTGNSFAKTAIAVAASSQTTMVLTTASAGRGLGANAVYTWGHGNHVPIRVQFESTYSSRVVNPVAIACARHHNVAITSDGHVFTWGLHADPLGTSAAPSGKNSAIPIPQLVTGMLPENGGGLAVAVAASENHTAVVTEKGELFTWGAADRENTLGYEGVRWQPEPRRVPGVQRIVAISAAKEHTVMLMGETLPAINIPTESLENAAARKLAEHADMFNAIPIAAMAERMDNDHLRKYCDEFIRRNLDGVMNVGQKSVMNTYLTEFLTSASLDVDGNDEDHHHPLIFKLLLSNASKRQNVRLQDLSSKEEWLEAINSLCFSANSLTLVERYTEKTGSETIVRREHSASITIDECDETASQRCMNLVADLNCSSKELAEERLASLTKEVRAIRKRLGQISKLEHGTSLGATLHPEEIEKLSRKSRLEATLKLVEPAIETVRKSIAAFLQTESQAIEQKDGASDSGNLVGNSVSVDCHDDEKQKVVTIGEENPIQENTAKVFRCVVCQVKCTDEKNYEIHINGRKHRNRLAQVEEEEARKIACNIMKRSNQQLMIEEGSPPKAATRSSNPWASVKAQTQPPLQPPSTAGTGAEFNCV